MQKEITYLDLFSGLGAFAKGFQDAGFVLKNHFFSEIDKYAIANYSYNFKNAHYVGSIQNIQNKNLPRPDLITFGSPCQDISLTGKRRGLKGKRSNLFFEAIKVLNKFRPRVFIFENVQGLFSSNKGQDFEIVLREIANLGLYECQWQLVNSAWFLPQNRERIYLVGFLREESSRQIFPLRIPYQATQEIQNRKIKILDKLNCNEVAGRIIDPKQGICSALLADSQGAYIFYQEKIRRLTAIECERLQGLPDDWTKYGIFDGEVKELSDTQRYSLTGNAVSTNVVTQIAKSILDSPTSLNGQSSQKQQEKVAPKSRVMQTPKIRIKTPISYYGGKQNMLKHLLPLIPKHEVYIEPFFGGGALFWAKEPSKAEIINDYNGNVVIFYEQLKKNFSALKKLIDATPYSREIYKQAMVIYNSPMVFEPLQRAWAFWVGTIQGFSNMIGSWRSSNGTGKDSAMNDNKKIAFDISLSTRLAHTQIENKDALELIKVHDSKDAFFYLDPPYVGTHLGHYGGYTQEHFDALLDALSKIKGKFLLSSFPNQSLENFIRKYKWHTTSKKMHHATSNSARTKNEILTSNYPLVSNSINGVGVIKKPNSKAKVQQKIIEKPKNNFVMINPRNYKREVSKLDISVLPEELQNGVNFIDQVTDNGTSWTKYNTNNLVKNKVNKHLKNLNDFLGKKPTKSTPRKKATTKTPRKTVVKKAKAPLRKAKPKAQKIRKPIKKLIKKAVIKPTKYMLRSSNKVEQIAEELKFIKRFVLLDGKPKTEQQIRSFINSLQRAMTEKRIRKTSAYAKEILFIQDFLLLQHKKYRKPEDILKIKIPEATKAGMSPLVGKQELLLSVKYIKRYIGLQGKQIATSKAQNLSKAIERSLKYKEITTRDPYHVQIQSISASLKEFTRKNPTSGTLQIPSRVLNGLYGAIGVDKDDDTYPFGGLSGINEEAIYDTLDIVEMKFETLGFKGKWFDFIGNPSRGFSMIVYAKPKYGKSNLCLDFAGYLARNHGKVLYVTKEEQVHETFRKKLIDLGVASSNFQATGSLPSDLSKWDFIFLDSLTRLYISNDELEALKSSYPDKSFISVLQVTKQGDARGSNQYIHNADVIVNLPEIGKAEQFGRFNQGAEMHIF